MKAAVIMVEMDDSGKVSFRDANGKVYQVSGFAGDYKRVIDSIIHDPTLPKLEDIPPQEANVETAIANMAKSIAPEPLRPFVAYGLSKLKAQLIQISNLRRKKSA